MVLVESHGHGCQDTLQCQGSVPQRSGLSWKRHSWQHGPASLQDQGTCLEGLHSNNISLEMSISAVGGLQEPPRAASDVNPTAKQPVTLLLIVPIAALPRSAVIN